MMWEYNDDIAVTFTVALGVFMFLLNCVCFYRD